MQVALLLLKEADALIPVVDHHALRVEDTEVHDQAIPAEATAVPQHLPHLEGDLNAPEDLQPPLLPLEADLPLVPMEGADLLDHFQVLAEVALHLEDAEDRSEGDVATAVLRMNVLMSLALSTKQSSLKKLNTLYLNTSSLTSKSQSH